MHNRVHLQAPQWPGNFFLGLSVLVAQNVFNRLILLGLQILGDLGEIRPELLQIQHTVQVQPLVVHNLQADPQRCDLLNNCIQNRSSPASRLAIAGALVQRRLQPTDSCRRDMPQERGQSHDWYNGSCAYAPAPH